MRQLAVGMLRNIEVGQNKILVYKAILYRVRSLISSRTLEAAAGSSSDVVGFRL
jgi:hypothetical protein